VDVHPVLLEGSAVSQPQLPRSGPDGQPIESSHLEHDAPKLTDFGGTIMLQNIDFDHVYDFGLIQSKIIVI
jgi:hypothetical protein